MIKLSRRQVFGGTLAFSGIFAVPPVFALPARNAPTLSLASNAIYPPPLSVTLDETVVENDVLRVQSSATLDFASLGINSTSTLSSAAIVSGNISVAGLSAISSPTQTYFRASVNGGAWSNIVKHGDALRQRSTALAASPL